MLASFLCNLNKEGQAMAKAMVLHDYDFISVSLDADLNLTGFGQEDEQTFVECLACANSDGDEQTLCEEDVDWH